MKRDDCIALAQAVIEHLSPKCTCHPAYKDRGLRDPGCEYCDIGCFLLPLAKKVLDELR